MLDYLTYASLFGGVLTLVLIQFRKLPLPGPLARQPWILRLHESGGGIPYGIALAAAALVVYPKTGWMPASKLSSKILGKKILTRFRHRCLTIP